MNVAIIPARGGSKRIPGKNIREFCGKPIIAYSIEAAIASGLFDRVIVSTDSDEIAKVAQVWGAEVPFKRPAEMADDYVGTDAVVLHALEWLMKGGDLIDFVCCIYSTAPFIRPEYIRQGYNDLIVASAWSAFTVATFPYSIFRALKMTQNERIEMIWPENFAKRSQDFPEAYHDAGQFYWANVEKYMEVKTFMSKEALPVVLPRHLVQDIDTEEDWLRAENMFRANGITCE